jgi:pyruvate/2-oxoglutarate/acetoin dehydrogenase E1 component
MALITYREAVRLALREELLNDERVFLIGEDIAEFGGSLKVTLGLIDEFGPKRVRNTPISEMAILGAAVGAAATGLRPIAEVMYSDFFGMAMDQVVNQAAKMRYMFGGKLTIPITIRAPLGGRRSAAAHHSQCLEAWFMHIPGLKIAMPSNAYDAKGLLKTAVRDPNPTIVFENKMLYNEKGEVPGEPYFVPWGQASVLREGTDVTIVALSDMVDYSLKAAEVAEAEGISVEVIDPRTIAPLDINTIVISVKKTGKLVVAHEANMTGGVGAEIAAQVGYRAFDYLQAPIERVAAKDTPVPFAPILEKAVLPDDRGVLDAIHRLIDYNG